MNEDIRIVALSREAVTLLGREECVVIIVDRGITMLDEGDGNRNVPNWGVRATDQDGHSARVNFETLPEETDEQVRTKLVELFGLARWL